MSRAQENEQNYELVIREAETQFLAVAGQVDGAPEFEREVGFALQALAKNDLLVQTARANPASLRNAIVNVAATGLSLNPMLKLAYLVPRDRAVSLDTSYRGLVKLHVDAGAVTSIRAELVYSNDLFEYHEDESGSHMTHKPELKASVRGELIGGWCRWKMPSGDSETRFVDAEAIEKRQNVSPAGRQGKGPWKEWAEEMQRKTVVRICEPFWPKCENRNLEAARRIDMVDPDEREPLVGADEARNVTDEVAPQYIDFKQVEEIRSRMHVLDVSEDQLCEAFEVENIECIPADTFDKVMSRFDDREKRIAARKAEVL